jgi:hypothetical protein
MIGNATVGGSGDRHVHRAERSDSASFLARPMSPDPSLVQALSDYGDTVEDIQRYVGSAGLPSGKIKWNQSVIHVWRQVLTEAEKHGKKDAVIAAVASEYETLPERLSQLRATSARTSVRSTSFEDPDWSNASPTTHLRVGESSDWPTVQAKRAVGGLDQLREAVNRVQDLTDRYQAVVKRRTETSKFVRGIERLSGKFTTADQGRLQSQRDAAEFFDDLDGPLHSELAARLPDLHQRAADYEAKLDRTRELVRGLREHPVDVNDVWIKAKELDGFWAQVHNQLYQEICNECQRMKDVISAHESNLRPRWG